MNYTTICIVMLSFLTPAVIGQSAHDSIPNGRPYLNPSGASSTYSTTGKIDLTGPFFQSMGSNGRSCASCHQPSDGMSVSAQHIEDRFLTSGGMDPIFRTVDGSNCNHDIDVSTLKGRRAAYKLLRTRGLIRVAIAVPPNADFEIVRADNPYSCNETDTISQYRRPLPSTNLRFLSAVMFDVNRLRSRAQRRLLPRTIPLHSRAISGTRLLMRPLTTHKATAKGQRLRSSSRLWILRWPCSQRRPTVGLPAVWMYAAQREALRP